MKGDAQSESKWAFDEGLKAHSGKTGALVSMCAKGSFAIGVSRFIKGVKKIEVSQACAPTGSTPLGKAEFSLRARFLAPKVCGFPSPVPPTSRKMLTDPTA